jgi:glutamate 5-kinase
MHTKCNVASKVADGGMPVVIANGKRENVILRVVDADPELPCTRFVPPLI